jgi:ubiquitin-protein ligase
VCFVLKMLYLYTVLTTLKNLMATPNPENPLEADIGTQYTNDRAAFNKVRVY